MKLSAVHVENFRAIRSLTVPLDPGLTVLHGNNATGKTSLLAAIAVGLGVIPTHLGQRGGIKFKKTDRRLGGNETSVRLYVAGEPQGFWWEREETSRGGVITKSNIFTQNGRPAGFWEYFDSFLAPNDGVVPTTIPVFAFYDTDRAVFGIPERKSNFRRDFDRFDAYDDALARKTSFKALVEWFFAQENAELRQQREKKSFNFVLPPLEAVRRAITTVMPDVSNPHIKYPARFVVQHRTQDGKTEELLLEQLSGGYRIVLALVADLALRLSLANPHLEDTLAGEAIVLIDEVELHLHPEWQQRILSDLQRTFPNVQFIVSTHSPQVLSTVAPHHIVHFRTIGDGVVAEQETGPTFGAKAGDVLEAVMGVDQRPENAFSLALSSYRKLVAEGQGVTEAARALRAQLQKLSPEDPALAAADVEIRRRQVMHDLAGRR